VSVFVACIFLTKISVDEEQGSENHTLKGMRWGKGLLLPSKVS